MCKFCLRHSNVRTSHANRRSMQSYIPHLVHPIQTLERGKPLIALGYLPHQGETLIFCVRRAPRGFTLGRFGASYPESVIRTSFGISCFNHQRLLILCNQTGPVSGRLILFLQVQVSQAERTSFFFFYFFFFVWGEGGEGGEELKVQSPPLKTMTVKDE